MCGIVGYIGARDVVPVLTGGLLKLEYRGYDSAGVAFASNGQLKVFKKKGKVQALIDLLDGVSEKMCIRDRDRDAVRRSGVGNLDGNGLSFSGHCC